MKRIIWLAAALLGLVSCSPEIYTYYLEVRQPSDSGMDLARKSMALVYMDSDVPADTAFNRSMASSLARALEEVPGVSDPGLEEILAADAEARRSVEAG